MATYYKKRHKNVIQLYRHIEILLLDNDCVIVPGLGGFMAHHTAAKYYEDTQTYVPPIRQLGFNGQLRINDSLLAQSYIEAYDISYPEAVRRIEDEVAEMMQTLQSKGHCELDDIGILRTSIDGHLEFEPCEAGILTPSLYGLDSVDIKPIAQRSTGKPDTQMAKSPVSVLTEQPHPESRLVMTHGDDTGTGDTEDTEDTEEKTIRIKVGTLRRVALVAAVVITLFICVLPLGKTTQPELTRSYIDTGVLFNILPEALRSTQDKPERYGLNDSGAIEQETIKAEDNTETAEPEPDQTTTQADGRMPEKDVTTEGSNTFYTIVLASRVTRTNGEAYARNLKEAGLDKAEVIERSNGAKVIYGRFTTQEEAKRCLAELRAAASAFKEGWVMEVR